MEYIIIKGKPYDPICFSVELHDIKKCLKDLFPFVKSTNQQSKLFADDELECNDYQEGYTFNDCFYEDKVTITLYEGWMNFAVLVDKVRISSKCSIDGDFQEIEFCVSLLELKEQIDQLNCKSVLFQEDRFWGFSVWDCDISQNFEIRAFSARKQLHIHPKQFYTLYPQYCNMKKEIMIDSLTDFSAWGFNDGYISYYISDKECVVIATKGEELKMKKYLNNIENNDSRSFCIPIAYATRMLDIYKRTYPYNRFVIYYNEKYTAFNMPDNITIEVPRIKERLNFDIKYL